MNLLSSCTVLLFLPALASSQSSDSGLRSHGTRSFRGTEVQAEDRAPVSVRIRALRPVPTTPEIPGNLLKAAPSASIQLRETGYEALATNRVPPLSRGEQLLQRAVDGDSVVTLTSRGVYVEREGEEARFLSHTQLWGDAVRSTEELTDVQLAIDRGAHRWMVAGLAVEERVSARWLLAVAEAEGPSAEWSVLSHELAPGTVTGSLRFDSQSVLLDVADREGGNSAVLALNKQALYGAAASMAVVSRRARPLATIPGITSASPNSGTGISQAFTFSFTPPGSTGILKQAQVIFNDHLDGAHACYAIYVAASNSLGLANDTGSTVTYQTLGSGLNLSNSQCTITQPGFSANNLSFTITFNTNFAGAKSIYLYDIDNDGTDTGWETKGSWSVPSVNSGAIPLSATVSPVSTYTQQIAFAYRDLAGSAQIRQVQALINTGLSGLQACYIFYDRSRAQAGLLSDDGSTINWLSPGSGTVSNTQCSFSGNFLTLAQTTDFTFVVTITFTPAFSGLQKIFMLAQDGVQDSNWFNKGSLIVPGPSQAPTIATAAPISGSGFNAVVSIVVQPDASNTTLNQIQFLMNSTLNGTNACFVTFSVSSGLLTLVNDAGTGGSQIPAGGPGTATNSQCTLNGGSFQPNFSGTLSSLTLNLTFKSAFAGNKLIYGLATAGAVSSGYTVIGDWSVPSSSIPPYFSSVGATSQAGPPAVVTVDWEARNAPLDTVQFIVGPAITGVGTCYIIYNPQAGTVGLVNDAGTATNYQPISSAPTLANSKCSVAVTNPANSDPGRSLGHFTVTAVTAFHGSYKVFGLVQAGALVTGWQILQSFTF